MKITKKNSMLGNVKIGKGVKLIDIKEIHCKEIGNYTEVRDNTSITQYVNKIGKFCSISSDVIIGLGMHPVSFVSSHSFYFNPEYKFVKQRLFSGWNIKKKINIQNDVWIGARALILPGIIINSGAIIGAGAVVTKNVPPYAIVGGFQQK